MSASYIAAVNERALDAVSASSLGWPREGGRVLELDGRLSFGEAIADLIAKESKEQPPMPPPSTADVPKHGLMRTLGMHKSTSLVCPGFIALLPNDDLCVSCCRTDQLVLLSPKGEHKRTIGGSGRAPGQFAAPSGLACDGEHLFVADHFNHRVQKLALPHGVPLACAGAADCADGAGVGEFESPEGVLLIGDALYVADRNNNRIVVLDTQQLTWRTSFGQEQLRCPVDLACAASALDVDGHSLQATELLVTDSANDRLAVYGLPDHRFVRAVDGFVEPTGVVAVPGLVIVAEEQHVHLLAWPSAERLQRLCVAASPHSSLKSLAAVAGRQLIVADEGAGPLHILAVDVAPLRADGQVDASAATQEVEPRGLFKRLSYAHGPDHDKQPATWQESVPWHRGPWHKTRGSWHVGLDAADNAEG